MSDDLDALIGRGRLAASVEPLPVDLARLMAALADALDVVTADINQAITTLAGPSTFDAFRPLLRAVGREDEFTDRWHEAIDWRDHEVDRLRALLNDAREALEHVIGVGEARMVDGCHGCARAHAVLQAITNEPR